MDSIIKYVNHPLDLQYLVEPTAETIYHAVEIGPPEEKEVHDLLAAAQDSQEAITIIDEIRSRCFGPTRRYKEYLDKWDALRKAVNKSPEHRAAACRMANNQQLDPEMRKDLQRIMAEV